MLKLKLYYPKEWSARTANTHANKHKFNPFICSKVHYDVLNEVRYMIIAKDAQFLDDITGESFSIIDKQPKLVMSESKLKHVGYDGYVAGCMTLSNKNISCVCEQIYFYINKKFLKKEYCGIVPHTIKYNSSYGKLYRDFPSIDVIKERVEKEGCHVVSKYLYELTKSSCNSPNNYD